MYPIYYAVRKASALATELLSAQENSRDLVDQVSKLQNKLDSASAEYALDKKLVEDISTENYIVTLLPIFIEKRKPLQTCQSS